jgi:PhnB protein
MLVQSYLFFEGRCDEAIAFYQRALDAKVEMLMRYKDHPDAAKPGTVPPGAGDKVMHASLHIGDSVVMLSDGHSKGKPDFQGFAQSLTVATEAEAEQRFKALADGGHVVAPLAKTFFSPRFGMVADRFGVTWIVMVAQ